MKGHIGMDSAQSIIHSAEVTAANVAEAIRLTNARQVDLSSGVESAPGVKDHAKIAAFVTAANRTN